ncbi:hypothetical protein ACHAWO_000734 [Cyclotella atomus]|uniref:Glycoside hydrolase family 5 domain-containing protein n=1 Tax=Cyclotella atomus TaxID=382360 RepID=A0ABD3PEN0_9STRA
MTYQSISINHGDDNPTRSIQAPSSRRHRFIAIFAAGSLLYITSDWLRLRLFSGSSSNLKSSSIKDTSTENPNRIFHDIIPGHQIEDVSISEVPIPTGVNLGSWLSLEDWFYVGENGAVEVASPDDALAASCLPPLHLDASTGPRWNSETDLLEGLANHYDDQINKQYINRTQYFGLGPYGKAIKTIHAFRSNYLDFDTDFSTMASLGIKYVRVPVSWCWTDSHPEEMITVIKPEGDDDNVKVTTEFMSDKDVKEKLTCEDPFYPGVRWPAIPRSFVKQFLRACAKHGIKATLDIHTYPGGTSIGTFSGVWPRYSRFWTHGDVPATDNGEKDVGRDILRNMIMWLENLSKEDPLAFTGLRALSPMNEPAHLAGLYNGPKPIKLDKDTFLPPLPPEMASDYLNELNIAKSVPSTATQVPDGNHLRVLMWLRDAVTEFRESKLPSLGIQLHVNVHESLLPTPLLPKYKDKLKEELDYALYPGALAIFGAWWRATTSPDERTSWAVLDIHHYHAWGDACSGAVEGPPTGRYKCSDEEARNKVLSKCSEWATIYRQTLEKECEPGILLASAEFSASTHHSVRHACNDIATLRTTYEMQLQAAKYAGVELFWWSYQMPYGGAFRNAWSLKHLLYLLGVLPRPDVSNFHCGDHIPPSGEPLDASI